jgi:hypothetical protein
MDLLKKGSLEGLLDHLARIHIVKINDEWRIAETTKKQGTLLRALGLIWI